MKTFLASVISALVLVLGFSTLSLSHPGRTAADGCHYCRTRCDYWGVPWNQRHCHGGGIINLELGHKAEEHKHIMKDGKTISHSHSINLQLNRTEVPKPPQIDFEGTL